MFFCLSLVSVSAFAFTDIESGSLSDTIEELQEYGIINGYPDGEFKPEDNITRAAFAKIIVFMMGITPEEEYTCSFEDTQGHWAKGFIEEAKDAGIINGTSSTTFAPEGYVTYEQIAKMTVCAVGYQDEAVENGGYPNGYIRMAEDLGILKDVDYTMQSDNATRANVAKIIGNTISVDIQYIDSEGTTFSTEITYKDFLNN